MAERAERNDPCPCGSGLKYKKCCESKDESRSRFPIGLAVLIGAIALLAAVGFAPSLFKRSESKPASTPTPTQNAAAAPLPADPMNPFSGNRPASTDETSDAAGAAATAQPAPSATPAPQPGQAPPGKVWSAEHGHWHDATAPPSPIQIQAEQLGTRSGSGAGAPPEPGMVWSEEHNHWHKAPRSTGAATRDPATGAPIGADPAPGPGQVRAFGQLVDVSAQPGTPQPPGDVPEGMVWSREHGHWHDVNTGEAPRP